MGDETTSRTKPGPKLDSQMLAKVMSCAKRTARTLVCCGEMPEQSAED